MGRLGTFVPRLAALTVVWLLATAALTYAAAQKTPAAPPAATTATAAPAAPKTLTVPDVRNQAYTFAKGTLTDAGFAWKVTGAVKGYPSNLVATQTPAPGTQVIDTGAPTIVLGLSKAGAQLGVPEAASTTPGTAIRLAALAVAGAPVVKAPASRKVATAKTTKPAKKAAPAKAKAKAPTKQAPAQSPKRPPAFTVPGARREPLDEMPLTARANALLRWLRGNPAPTDANVERWLFQHAWIVAGARMGWWHGDAALRTLVRADREVWRIWGIGARSEQVAKQALAEVEARTR